MFKLAGNQLSEGGLGLNLVYLASLVAVLALLVLYEVPAMIKHKHWRDLVVFSVLSLSVFTVSLLMLMGVDVPSPIILIQAVVNGLQKLWARP